MIDPKRAISKIGGVSTDRNVAQAPAPGITTGSADSKTQITTYFTKIPVVGEDTPIIYNGDRLWARVILTLETAGPVAVSNMSSIAPVLSGKGELLTTGVPFTYDVAKGNRLYIAATGVNRVKVQIQAFPWLEVITGLLNRLVSAFVPKTSVEATKAKSKL